MVAKIVQQVHLRPELLQLLALHVARGRYLLLKHHHVKIIVMQAKKILILKNVINVQQEHSQQETHYAQL